jgi:Na+-translocating ferredoxin:NAD+ oxidoreductase subunit B
MSSEKNKDSENMERRDFLKKGATAAAFLSLGGIVGVTVAGSSTEEFVWQIDPHLCVQCGLCATKCVMSPSAVKCIHAYDMCGYCDLCGGYSQPNAVKIDTAAENQLCPTAAIKRTFIEDPYYEYSIDETLCIGCAICVKGCAAFGNGSLYMQVRHDRCVNCNDCEIAKVCPSKAFKRVPVSKPYILKGEQADR